MSKKDPKVDAIVKAAAVDVVELTSYRSQATELQAFLAAAPCVSPVQEQWFDQQLASVRALLKSLEEKRTSITKPMNAAKAAVDALFSPASQPLKKCEEIIRDKLLGAANARLTAERAALAAATAAATAGKPLEALAALADRPAAPEARTGSSTGSKWVVKSANVREMAKDHQATGYLMADPDALQSLCRACDDGPAPVVAGVVFERVATLRAKGI